MFLLFYFTSKAKNSVIMELNRTVGDTICHIEKNEEFL